MPGRAKRTFTLPPEEVHYIDALVASGTYRSPSEVVDYTRFGSAIQQSINGCGSGSSRFMTRCTQIPTAPWRLPKSPRRYVPVMRSA